MITLLFYQQKCINWGTKDTWRKFTNLCAPTNTNFWIHPWRLELKIGHYVVYHLLRSGFSDLRYHYTSATQIHTCIFWLCIGLYLIFCPLPNFWYASFDTPATATLSTILFKIIAQKLFRTSGYHEENSTYSMIKTQKRISPCHRV